MRPATDANREDSDDSGSECPLVQAVARAAALADGLVDAPGASVPGGGPGSGNGRGRGAVVTGAGAGALTGARIRGGANAGATQSSYGVGSTGAMLGVMVGGGKKQKPPGLRRGKWTPEEEKYANR